MKSVITTGTITNEGKLSLLMDVVREFAQKNKGSRVAVKISVINPSCSKSLRGYYYGYVVPTFRRAMWESGDRRTEEQAERFMRELSPIMYDQQADDNGRYRTRIKDIGELDNSEMIEHINTIKQIAAEEYSAYIEDPR